MKIYLLSIMCLSALVGGCTYLTNGKKCEKYIRYLGMLVIFIALLAPLKNFLEDGIHFENFSEQPGIEIEGSYETAIINEAEKSLQTEFSALISNMCGLKEEEFSVSVTVTCFEKKLSVPFIEISMYSIGAVTKREKIRDLLGNYCETILFKEEFTE